MGTIVVDLERSDVIDLLPDRDADTVAAWLKDHPGVEVVSRDRSATYAQAATEGASQAEQVADRWHLLKNLREAVERVLERHSAVVDAVLKTTETPTEPAQVAAVPEPGAAALPVESSPPRPPSEPLPESPRLHAEQSKRHKRIDRFEQVHELHRRGHSVSRIARELGLSRRSVFRYLWNVSRPAIRHNPAIRALYGRLKAKGKREDVVIGHCMRKLLHLVFAVWKTDRPFDPKHFPWEGAGETESSTATPSDPGAEATPSAKDKAAGHKRDKSANEVVTTAVPTVGPDPSLVKTPTQSVSTPRPRVDFKYLREQVTMEQVIRHLGLLANLRGRGQQRRGPCPVHSHPGAAERTFSVHLDKNAFQCFHADCAVQGNVLDLWAAIHRLPLYEAALHLAETFDLPRNREEEPVI
jgi:DNA-binding NarL/FixJ family response regulator